MFKKMLLITAVIITMTFAAINVLTTIEIFRYSILWFLFNAAITAVLAYLNVKSIVFLLDFKIWRVIFTAVLGAFTIFIFIFQVVILSSGLGSYLLAIYLMFNAIGAAVLVYPLGIFIKDLKHKNGDDQWKIITIISIIGISFVVLNYIVCNAIDIPDYKPAQDLITYFLIKLSIPIVAIVLAVASFVYQHKEKVENKQRIVEEKKPD
ncbi:MAG: hypothetical protein K6E21_02315 [Bacilli bacterium]|nr:hypothetical protein [Bacilli bacterium]